MTIDIEKLRQDLIQDCCGAYFGGGFGAAIPEAVQIEKASPEELIHIAQEKGIDLRRYAVN